MANEILANIQEALRKHKVKFATRENIIEFFIKTTKELYKDDETGEINTNELVRDIALYLHETKETKIDETIDFGKIEV